MGYHECPIEPWDWNNGDGGAGDCMNCEGTGEIIKDDDTEALCPKCEGTGFTVYDDEPEYGDFA